MARVFLDTNIFIDLVHRRPDLRVADSLESKNVFVSVLSYHIFFYLYKIKPPYTKKLEEQFLAKLDLTENILEKSFVGPTQDLEDNIQLHSAVEAEADYFFTNDKEILNMKFFGKMKIVDSLIK